MNETDCTQTSLDLLAVERALGLAGKMETTSSAARLPPDAGLGDVWDGIRSLGEEAGLGLLAASVVAGLEARLRDVERRLAVHEAREVSLSGPWAPVRLEGHGGAHPAWCRALIAAAGGRLSDGSAEPTEEPDVGVEVRLHLGPPPGVNPEGARPDEPGAEPDARPVALDLRRVGPDLARAAEVLAAAIHPEACPDLVRRHAAHLGV
jgi:hypothetical protein